MKPMYLLFLFALLFSSLTFGQIDKIIQDQKVYKKNDGSSLYVDMFYCKASADDPTNPAIAFFHGGGWAFGSPSEFHAICKRYASMGFITFSFQYGLSITEKGTFPHPAITPVESTKDARSAIRWLRENATELNLDPEKIVVCGQSAGGQLAISTALLDSLNESKDNLKISATPNALVLYSSNLNTVEVWVDKLLGNRRNEIWSISPYHNLKAGMPPAIEFHGTKDCHLPFYTVEFYTHKTRELGNHFEQIRFEGIGHYLGKDDETYATCVDEEILERTDKFLTDFGFMPNKLFFAIHAAQIA